MSTERSIADAIVAAVVPLVVEQVKRERGLMHEDDVMEMLHIASKSTMAKWRSQGLKGYQPMGRDWFYFLDDVHVFIRRGGSDYR